MSLIIVVVPGKQAIEYNAISVTATTYYEIETYYRKLSKWRKKMPWAGFKSRFDLICQDFEEDW